MPAVHHPTKMLYSTFPIPKLLAGISRRLPDLSNKALEPSNVTLERLPHSTDSIIAARADYMSTTSTLCDITRHCGRLLRPILLIKRVLSGHAAHGLVHSAIHSIGVAMLLQQIPDSLATFVVDCHSDSADSLSGVMILVVS